MDVICHVWPVVRSAQCTMHPRRARVASMYTVVLKVHDALAHLFWCYDLHATVQWRSAYEYTAALYTVLSSWHIDGVSQHTAQAISALNLFDFLRVQGCRLFGIRFR